MNLAEELSRYTPWDAREAADKAYILSRLPEGSALYTRESLDAHMTASAWVVSRDGKQVLMAYHNIYKSWAWLGGHADGDADLLAVARREAEEESGVTGLVPLSQTFLSLEVLPVQAHIRRGKPVDAHLHLNFTYLFQADETLPLSIRPEENSAVGWIPVEKIAVYSSEPLFQQVIYPKLCKKTNQILHLEDLS